MTIRIKQQGYYVIFIFHYHQLSSAVRGRSPYTYYIRFVDICRRKDHNINLFLKGH